MKTLFKYLFNKYMQWRVEYMWAESFARYEREDKRIKVRGTSN